MRFQYKQFVNQRTWDNERLQRQVKGNFAWGVLQGLSPLFMDSRPWQITTTGMEIIPYINPDVPGQEGVTLVLDGYVALTSLDVPLEIDDVVALDAFPPLPPNRKEVRLHATIKGLESAIVLFQNVGYGWKVTEVINDP